MYNNGEDFNDVLSMLSNETNIVKSEFKFELLK